MSNFKNPYESMIEALIVETEVDIDDYDDAIDIIKDNDEDINDILDDDDDYENV